MEQISLKNKINILKFNKYDSSSEIFDTDESKTGDYWKFLNLNTEEISELFRHSVLCEIVSQISNEELKNKIKDKLLKYIEEEGLCTWNAMNLYKSKLLNSDELSNIFGSDKYKEEQAKNISENDSTNIEIIVNMYLCLDYDNLKFSGISEIIELIKSRKDFEKRVMEIIMRLENSMIYSEIIKKYYDLLPEFYRNYLKAKSNPNYLYEKSLKFASQDIGIGIDSSISIGTEIEANGNGYFLFKDFFSKQNKINKYFKVETDVTVPNGIEVISYPFNDKIEDISNFCAVCESMQELGYYYDEQVGNAAGQINLGLDYLDSAKSILIFYELFGNCEELLFYISNEEGQLIRTPIMTSRFRPISKNIGTRIVDEEISRDSVIKMFNVDTLSMDNEMGLTYKENSVCLRGTSDDDYRFEIKISNASVDYNTWFDNIRLYGKMMEISKKIADALKKDYLSEDEEKMLNIYIDLQDENLNLTDKLILLMDLLFNDMSIKEIYYNRYVSTMKKIKETQKSNYYIANIGNVQFQSSYESKIEDSGNITYDPETGIYEENGIRRKI